MPWRARTGRRRRSAQLIREQTLKRHIQPVLCGSGREHIGIQPLLDAAAVLPAQPARPAAGHGHQPEEAGQGGERKPDPKEPFCGLVFKASPTRTATCSTSASTPAR